MSNHSFQSQLFKFNTNKNFSSFEDEKNIEIQLQNFRENSSRYCVSFSSTMLTQKLNYRVPFFRILYISKGDIQITLDQHRLHLCAGSFIIANSNTHITYQAENEKTEVLTMCFKWAFFSQHLISSFRDCPLFIKFIQTNLDPNYHKSNFLFFNTPQNEYRSFLVHSLLINITAEHYRQEISEAAFLLLFSHLDDKKEAYLNIKESTVQSNLLISDIIEFIQAHYQTVSLQKLATTYHLHPNYLSLLIKDETGLLFSEHLTNIRMKKATEFLVNTKMSIEGISEQIGYSDKSYFFKIFKKIYGMSPRIYRKAHTPEV